jgi:hypothetical protein
MASTAGTQRLLEDLQRRKQRYLKGQFDLILAKSTKKSVIARMQGYFCPYYI